MEFTDARRRGTPKRWGGCDFFGGRGGCDGLERRCHRRCRGLRRGTCHRLCSGRLLSGRGRCCCLGFTGGRFDRRFLLGGHCFAFARRCDRFLRRLDHENPPELSHPTAHRRLTCRVAWSSRTIPTAAPAGSRASNLLSHLKPGRRLRRGRGGLKAVSRRSRADHGLTLPKPPDFIHFGLRGKCIMRQGIAADLARGCRAADRCR